MGRNAGPFEGGFQVNRLRPGCSRKRSPVQKILRNRFEDIESGTQPQPHRRQITSGKIRKHSRNHNVRTNCALIDDQQSGTSSNYSASLFPVGNKYLRRPAPAENPWMLPSYPDAYHNVGGVSTNTGNNSPWLPIAVPNNHDESQLRGMPERGWDSTSQLLEITPSSPNLWKSPGRCNGPQAELWPRKPNYLSSAISNNYRAELTGRIPEEIDPNIMGNPISSLVKQVPLQQNFRASPLPSQTPLFCTLPRPGGHFLNHTSAAVKALPMNSLSKSLSATALINHHTVSATVSHEALDGPAGNNLSMFRADSNGFPNQDVSCREAGNPGSSLASKSGCASRDRIHEQNNILQSTENRVERKPEVMHSKVSGNSEDSQCISEQIVGNSVDSYELKFIEISDRLGLKVKSSPNMKTDVTGQRLYGFSIELSRNLHTVSAEGPYVTRIEEAREQAYKAACSLAVEVFSPNREILLPNNRNSGDACAELQPAKLLKEKTDDSECAENYRGTHPVEGTDTSACESGFARGQTHSKREVHVVKPGLLPTPTKPQKPPLLETPPLNPTESASVMKNLSSEDRFKDYMDALHMQCWLKLNYKNEPRRKLVSVTLEVQSYDQKFHEFYVGSYSDTEDMAKESAFKIACTSLERGFPNALKHLSGETVAPSQRTFMDLRSTLGLIVRFLPEIKLDLHNRQKYSYTIEFCREGGNLPEVVHSEFCANEADAKERAFKLAVERIHYLHGSELDALYKKKTFRPSWPSVPTGTTANNTVPRGRLFNPHSQAPRRQALVTPLIHSSQKPNPTSSVESESAGQSRTHQCRFEELAGLLNTEFKVRKIPQFDGGHKVYAFEITFQGKNGGRGLQKIMGEYFWDEVAARDSAFKHATEQLRRIYGY